MTAVFLYQVFNKPQIQEGNTNLITVFRYIKKYLDGLYP